MEWKRNKQDTWHLARGTSGQKSRRNRKQPEAASQSSPRTVPPGFSTISGSSGPPPVNAWAQKKGSALFSKPDEVDEEDEMLKLVLEESLKTAEEDQKRAFERIKMSNKEVAQQVKNMSPAEKGWEDTDDQSASSCVAFTKIVGDPNPKPYNRAKSSKREIQPPANSNYPPESKWQDGDSDYPASSPEQPRQPAKKELHFVDTDPVEDSCVMDRRRVPRHRTKKTPTSDTQDHSSAEMLRTNNQVSPPLQNEFKNKSKIAHQTLGSRLASPTPKYNDFGETQPARKYSPPANTGFATPNISYGNPVPSYEINQNTIVPEKDHNISSVKEFSTSFSSNLTFGDTQGLLEKIHSDYTYQTPSVADNYLLDTSAYQLKTESTKTSLRSSFSDSIDETDVILHNFIRHDPPSGNNAQYLPPDATDAVKPTVNGFLNSNPFVLHNDDSSSSVSDSSVQNASPYGSYEKQMTYGLPGMQPQNSQYPYVFPPAQNLQMQSNLVSPMGFSGVPPGYAAPRGIVPHNPQMPGMPQYCMPNSNMMMPPALDPQAQLLAMIHYQTIIAGMQKDQNRVIPQPPVMPTQTQPINIPDDPVKQEINSSQTQPSHKSKEEIMIDYQKTLQALNKLQMEWASQVETPAVNPPLPVYTGYPTPTGLPVMGLYGGVPVMHQQSCASPSQLSPNIQQQQRFTTPAPNPDAVFDPNAQPSGEPPVGRGRGRLV